MTAKNILDAALPLMGVEISEEESYTADFIPVLNILLAEAFDVNNSIRAAAGQEELTDIPSIAELDDAVPYDAKLCRMVLPYGAAGILYFEDNAALATQYKQKYEYELGQSAKAVYTQIDNYYGDLSEDE